MRLKDASLEPYTIRLSHLPPRSGAILSLKTSRGQKSFGDLAPLHGWSRETLLEASHHFETLKSKILQTNWKTDSYLQTLKNFALLPSLSFALESALSELLWPTPFTSVPMSALLIGSREEILKEASRTQKLGIVSAKLKVSKLRFEEAKSLIDQLKNYFSLRIDVNRAWKTKDSLDFFANFPLDTFDYVEEPFQNPKDLYLFPHPLAIDESFPDDLSLKDLESLPTLKALVYKPTIQGGLERVFPLAKWTQQRNISLILSSALESDLGIFQIASMARRLSLKEPLGIGTYFYLKDFLCEHRAAIFKGSMYIPKTVPSSVAGAIFSSDRSQVLLIQRRDVPVWVLPGGGIDRGESAEEAIIREIQEETGLSVEINRLVGDYTPLNRLAKQTQLFECTPRSQEHLLASAECKNIRFFPLSRLPKEIPPPYREWIADAFEQKPPVFKTLSSVTYRRCTWYLLTHPILVCRFLLARLGFPINT